MDAIEIFGVCQRCGGSGVYEYVHEGVPMTEDPCTACGGDGQWAGRRYIKPDVFEDIIAKQDDILDKCDDIIDKCDDILEQLSE